MQYVSVCFFNITIYPISFFNTKWIWIMDITGKLGAIALSYPPRVRVRATVKHSAAFFHDESSITIEGVRKCKSTESLMIKLYLAT